ncbi:MAG: glycosyltransferase family 1 protein [Kiritimatiellia bacterium]|nr:glycosyltransferase family 1 protein [Kiritimatiellia bacterium]
MNIGWDMVDIPPNKDGTFEFISRWLHAVATYPLGHHHMCYANAAFRRALSHPALDAIEWHIAGDWTGGYQLRREQFYLQHRRRIHKQIDILISVYRPPLVWNGKSITIVLDCTKELFPTVRGVKNHLLASLRDYGARRAGRWLAISEWTRRDAARLRGYDPERIRSAGIPLAELADESGAGRNSSVSVPFGITGKFAFYCSAISAHKNHLRLIRAWKKAFPNREVQLVLAGRLLPNIPSEIINAIRQAEAEGVVRALGLVSDEDRERLYAGADFVVYPSLCEGFGMPVLEAMRYGKPVLTSSGTATEEVGGDAVLLCDPRNEDDMVAKLRQIAIDKALRKRLQVAIPGRLARYSQENVARELHAAIDYLTGLH